MSAQQFYSDMELNNVEYEDICKVA